MLRKDSIEIYHILLAVLLAGTLFYGLFEARVLLGAFKIQIDNPTNGVTLTDPLLAIEGKVRHAESIQINGRTIPVNRDNTFSESYLLSPGYNEVAVTAANKFGKSEEVILHLFLATPTS